MPDYNEFLPIADTTDIELGHSQSVHLNGIDILICHAEDGFFAVEDLCTHSMSPLCGGLINGNYITCPLHGAEFDLTDGSVQSPPAFEDLRTFKLKIDGTSISINSDSLK
jgi:3-phenylpropionate/trans-cinnamate dioxygenase ferredoxin subunit